MSYRQITSDERYLISKLRQQGFNQSRISAVLGRHRSSISREIQRIATAAGGRAPVGILASRRSSGNTSIAGCAGSGAPSKSPDDCAAMGPGRSVTRPSTRTSGMTRHEAGSSFAICVVPPSNAANDTALMTAGAASRASA